ncbi:MAG: MoaD/ThiS family protein [Gaiellaceae bacterium]
MVAVVLPSLLATQAGGRKRFEVDAATVESALRGLPIADLLFDDDGALRPLVNVYVDGADVRYADGLSTPVSGGQTVRVVTAVAGG